MVKLQEVYRSKADRNFKIGIVSVNESKNTAYGINNYDGRKLAYRIDSLLDYWELTEDVYTRVVFKKYNDGTPIAFLLDLNANRYNVVCYEHVGQHGEANVEFARECKSTIFYDNLKRELERVGYFVDVKKRFPNSFVTGKEM